MKLPPQINQFWNKCVSKFAKVATTLNQYNGLLTAISTAVVAVLTIFIVLDSHRQGETTNRELLSMRTQSTTMEAQLHEMQIEDLPQIGFKGIDHIPDSKAIMVAIINGGHSPALHAYVYFGYSYSPNSPPLVPNTRCNVTCRISDFDMSPNVPFAFRAPSVSEFYDGTTPLWIVYRIDYQDGFGGDHATGICLEMLPTPGNDIRTCDIPNSNYSY